MFDSDDSAERETPACEPAAPLSGETSPGTGQPTSNVSAGAGMDVRSTPTERLEAQVAELAAHLAAATCRFLLMVAELDRRQAWGTWGMRSSAHWLSWHCGVGLATAREQVRVANALGELPKLTAEFAAGRLSYSKVRAMTRIATPELEHELIELARASTAAQVERWVRGYRRASCADTTDPPRPDDHDQSKETADVGGDSGDSGESADMDRVDQAASADDAEPGGVDGDDKQSTSQGSAEPEETAWTSAARGEFGAITGDEAERVASRQAEKKSLLMRPEVSWFFDEDGCLVFKARLPAEDGSLLLAALEVARKAAMVAPDVSAETPAPDSTTKDAAEKAADGKDEGRVSGDADGTSDAAAVAEDCSVLVNRGRVTRGEAFMSLIRAALELAPTDTSGADRYQVMVHVDRDALLGADTGVRGGRCELRDGPSIPVETAWRLACDAMFRTMYHDAAGRPVNFGRNKRLVSVAQRRLLLARDGGCAFPGCQHRQYLHAHHVKHWLHGGDTDLDNLVLLCSAHHGMVHEGGLIVRAHGDGRFTFHTADRRLIRSAPPRQFTVSPLDQFAVPYYQPPSDVTPETMGGGWHGDRADTDAIVWGLLQRGQQTGNPMERLLRAERRTDGVRVT